MDLIATAQLYRDNLADSKRFWLTHSLDQRYGGYWTCIDRRGVVYDERKYVWLMGRAVWMFSKLGELDAAKLILDFLLKHACNEQGGYYFSLHRDGRPAFYQRKPYGAVFVCIGLAEYARATQQQGFLDQAVELFWKIRDWIADPLLLGRRRHGLSQLADVMVTISMLLELMPSHDDPRYPELLNAMLDEALAHQHPELGVFLENLTVHLTHFWLRVTAAACIAITVVTTLTVNVPINSRTTKWQLTDDPTEWDQIRARWHFFQGVRGGLFLLAFAMLAFAMLIPRRL